MRRKLFAIFFMLIVSTTITTSAHSISRAEEGLEAADLIPVRITGYCLKGKTADGTPVHEGICAYKKSDIGKLARVYNSDGTLLGEYEIHDTGKGGVRKGTVVDIWKPTKAECFALTRDGYVQIIEKEDEQTDDSGEREEED